MRSRVLAVALAGALAIPLGLASTAPPTAAIAAVSGADFDLAAYLRTSPQLADTIVDLGQLRGRVSDFRVISENYEPTGALGYKTAELVNNTDIQQTMWTTSRAVTYTNQTTYSVGHTMSTGASLTFEYGVSAPITKKFSVTTFFSYAAKIENSYNVKQDDTVTLMQQPIAVPAGQTVLVNEWYEQGRYDAKVQLQTRLVGSVSISACGKSVTVPIGALLARGPDLGLAALPEWLRVDGDDLLLVSDLTFMSTPAVRQVVEVTASNGTKAVLGDPAPSFDANSASGTRSLAERSAAAPSTLPELPRCRPVTADGSAVLLPDGRIIDPEWGMELRGPSGVTFTAVSGARWHGVGASLSAIDTNGTAYWLGKSGPFVAVSLPTKAVATADGVAILGADGNVYNAAGGNRINSPGGVRFTSVSGVHNNNDSFYYSAIGRDGAAYWSERGAAFARLDLPTRALRTINGAIIVGADGQLYNARSGAVIPNPEGAQIASVSATVDWCHGGYCDWGSYGLAFAGHSAVAVVVDPWGEVWASIAGSPLRRHGVDAGFGAAASTSDGTVGIDTEGRIFAHFAPSVSTPRGVRFAEVSVGPDSLQYPTISAVTTDGRVFWSSWGQPFREVAF